MEEIKKYSFEERLEYTKKRNWFCGKDIIASNMDIHIDWIWREIQVANIKAEAIRVLEKSKNNKK